MRPFALLCAASLLPTCLQGQTPISNPTTLPTVLPLLPAGPPVGDWQPKNRAVIGGTIVITGSNFRPADLVVVIASDKKRLPVRVASSTSSRIEVDVPDDAATAMLRRIEESMQQASSDDRTVRAILAARIALAQNRIAAARSALESATDTTRSDYTLPALIDVFMAGGHRDSALVAATRFESRAVFGIDAQDAWLRNLLTKGRIAEQLGQMDVATTAYARLESQLKSGDADHPLLVEARRGLARLAVIDARAPVRR